VGLVCLVGDLYLLAIFARMVLSWFPMQRDGLGAQLHSVLFSITEPVLGPLRRAIPRAGMFDLSPLIVVIGWQFLLRPAIC
jgi:YggT family protein